MTPSLCLSCDGFCCVNYEDDKPNIHVEYAKDCSYSARVYAHFCPDCDNGTCDVRPPPTTEPPRTYDEGVADERSAVAAWLRECAHTAHTGNTAGELLWAAIRIERGAHHREEGE